MGIRRPRQPPRRRPLRLAAAAAPSCAEPVPTHAGVRQGDPLGTLLFAVAMQLSPECANGAANGATIVAMADDVAVAGRVHHLRTATHCLARDEGVRAAADLPVSACSLKCIIAAGRVPECAAAGAALAAELRVRRQPEGATCAGPPSETNVHVESVVGAHASNTVERLDKLLNLALSNQFSLPPLRRSLSRRMLHLQCSVPWARLAPAARRVEQRILTGATALLQLTQGGLA